MPWNLFIFLQSLDLAEVKGTVAWDFQKLYSSAKLIILLQMETNFSISKRNEPVYYLKKTFLSNCSEAVYKVKTFLSNFSEAVY